MDITIHQGIVLNLQKSPIAKIQPIQKKGGIIHYCVGNLSTAVSLTSTMVFTSTPLRYGLYIADGRFKNRLNCHKDKCTHEAVAKSLGLNTHP